MEARLDFVAPHRPRNKESPGQTGHKTRERRRRMEVLGRVVPVHFQEPFRRGYPGFVPEANDYSVDLQGAGGWCFHNGSSRGTEGEQPRRSFDLTERRLFAQLDTVELDAVSRFRNLVATKASPFRVRHTKL